MLLVAAATDGEGVATRVGVVKLGVVELLIGWLCVGGADRGFDGWAVARSSPGFFLTAVSQASELSGTEEGAGSPEGEDNGSNSERTWLFSREEDIADRDQSPGRWAGGIKIH